MTRSKVVDPLTGGGKDSRFEHCLNSNFRDVTMLHYLCVILILLDGDICSSRTSTGMFLSRGQDATVHTIEKRIEEYTSIPIGMCVLPPSRKKM